MPGWKSVQSKKKIKRKTKLALAVLGIILAIILTGWIVKFTQTLLSPWQLSSDFKKKYIWDGEFNINVVLKSKDIAFLSYNPSLQEATIIGIPDETMLEVFGGFGKWQAGSIFDLGESQKKGGGSKLLKTSLMDLLGLPVDGFLQFEGPYSSKNTKEIVENLRKNSFEGFNLLFNLKSDLTLYELIRLKFALSSIRYDKVRYLDLESMGILEKGFLADNTPIFTFDPVRIDSISAGLPDPQIQSEHKTVAIFNSTDYPLIAQKGARIITNLGGNVIIIANSEKKLKKTKVSGEKSKTLKRFKQIFESEAGKEMEISSRAQINVMLGEDFFNGR